MGVGGFLPTLYILYFYFIICMFLYIYGFHNSDRQLLSNLNISRILRIINYFLVWLALEEPAQYNDKVARIALSLDWCHRLGVRVS